MTKVASLGSDFQFLEISDNGDGVVGSGDKLVFRDGNGERHEYRLSDRRVTGFLSGLGASIGGMPVGRAQSYIQFQALRGSAERLSAAGNNEELGRILQQMQNLASAAGVTYDRNWGDSLMIDAYLNSASQYAGAPGTMGVVMANSGIGDARHLARILFERGGPDRRAEVRDRSAVIVRATMDNALSRADEAARRGDTEGVDQWLKMARGFVTDHAGRDVTTWANYQVRADGIRDTLRLTIASR